MVQVRPLVKCVEDKRAPGGAQLIVELYQWPFGTDVDEAALRSMVGEVPSMNVVTFAIGDVRAGRATWMEDELRRVLIVVPSRGEALAFVGAGPRTGAWIDEVEKAARATQGIAKVAPPTYWERTADTCAPVPGPIDALAAAPGCALAQGKAMGSLSVHCASSSSSSSRTLFLDKAACVAAHGGPPLSPFRQGNLSKCTENIMLGTMAPDTMVLLCQCMGRDESAYARATTESVLELTKQCALSVGIVPRDENMKEARTQLEQGVPLSDYERGRRMADAVFDMVKGLLQLGAICFGAVMLYRWARKRVAERKKKGSTSVDPSSSSSSSTND